MDRKSEKSLRPCGTPSSMAWSRRATKHWRSFGTSMPKKITVDTGGKERLDKFLVRYLVDQSRSQIQKRIEAGTIQVNGRATSAHAALKRGDIVTIDDNLTIRQEPTPKNLPRPSIIYEDDNFLVINKPSGLTVHAGVGIEHGT